MFTLQSYLKKAQEETARILNEADMIRAEKIKLAAPVYDKAKKSFFQNPEQVKQLIDFIQNKEILFVEIVKDGLKNLIKNEHRFITLLKQHSKQDLIVDVEWYWRFFRKVKPHTINILSRIKKEKGALNNNNFIRFAHFHDLEQEAYSKIDKLTSNYQRVGVDVYDKTKDKVIGNLIQSKGTTFRRVASIVNIILIISFTTPLATQPAYAFDIYRGVAKLMGFKKPVREAVEKTVNESMDELAPSINKYSNELGVDARIVAGVIYVEMFRNLTTEKGFIEQKLESRHVTRTLLKIKGHTVGIGQIHMQVMERCIENFNNPNSPFYMGKEFENYVTWKDFDKAEEAKNYVDELGIHHSEYTNPDAQIKFVAAMIAQLQTQWKNAGYDISDKPEILGTLYNLGFDKSNPKANPRSGGSINFIFGKEMRFGDAVKAWCDSGLNARISSRVDVAKK